MVETCCNNKKIPELLVSTLFIYLLTGIVILPNITFKLLSCVFSSMSIYLRTSCRFWAVTLRLLQLLRRDELLEGLLRGARMTPCMHGGETNAHAGHAKGVGVRWQAITDCWQVGYCSDRFRTCDQAHRTHALTTKFVFFNRCTVHFDIQKAHSPTNALI